MRTVYTDGISQDELDIMWFLDKATREGGYFDEIVVLRRREVIGRGRSYTEAWDDALAKAAAAGGPAPLDTEVVYVPVGPKLTWGDLGLPLKRPGKAAGEGTVCPKT